MIVTPEFPTHWKTQRLVEITRDRSAPLAVLNGWAYCQVSRTWQFPEMTVEQLAGVCRWGEMQPPCDEAMLEAGFIVRFRNGFAFHDWEQVNSQLIQKWTCGKRGGRPKSTAGNRKQTGKNRPVSSGNRPVSSGNRERTDQTRSDKIRSDETGLEALSAPIVNIVNAPGMESDLTKLTKEALPRVAREIAGNTRGWCYDNCKVISGNITSKSLETVLKPFVGKVTERKVHACWAEAATRAHKCTVDGMTRESPEALAVVCLKEQLSIARGGE